tara:strand:+ start:79 stop:522 length:444 start_codon:yes stop_codon:yes gene_type:complete
MAIYKKWFRGPVQFADSADEEHRRNVREAMCSRRELWDRAPEVYSDLKSELAKLLPRAELTDQGELSFRLRQSGVTLVQAVLSTKETKLKPGQVIELWLSVVDYTDAPEDVSVRDIHDVVNATFVYASPESLLDSGRQTDLLYSGLF